MVDQISSFHEVNSCGGLQRDTGRLLREHKVIFASWELSKCRRVTVFADCHWEIETVESAYDYPNVSVKCRISMSCLKQLYIHYALSLLTSTPSYFDTLPLRCLDVTCDPVEMDKAHTARQGCDAFMRKIRMIERIPS